MENSNEKTISVNSMFGDRKIQVNMEDFIDRWVSGGSVDQMWKISELPEDMEIIHGRPEVKCRGIIEFNMKIEVDRTADRVFILRYRESKNIPINPTNK